VDWIAIDFRHLTGCASSDVFCDESFYVGPPVIWGDELEGFGNPRMSGCFMVVKKGNYPPPKSIVCHDDHGGAMEPMSAVHSGEIMWASPFL
jgi:hypothetical protein